MRIEVRLGEPSPNVFVPYPNGFDGDRTSAEASFILSTAPVALSRDEIPLALAAVERLTKVSPQSLKLAGLVRIDADDPLLDLDAESLERFGAIEGFPLPVGSEPYQQVLAIREFQVRKEYAALS
jgi:hypothetical protein